MGERKLLGIFDSGVGGFSVFKEIRKTTEADILYFGDCANAPYGNKTQTEIIVCIRKILTNLQTKGVTHFVSACNSMSVFTTDTLLHEMGIGKEKYIDMVGAVKIISFEEGDIVLIVGTNATIASGVYQSILQEKKISFEVFSPVALAGNIEKGDRCASVNDVDEVLLCAIKGKANKILYACTHYPLVDNLFKEKAQEHAWGGVFIDPAFHIGKKISEWNLSGTSGSIFETSLETDVFRDYKKKIW